MIPVGHSTGAALAALLAARSDSSLHIPAMVLVSFSSGLPMFLRSLARTQLGRSVVLQLLRSELSSVMLTRAWSHPETVNPQVLANYRYALSAPSSQVRLQEMLLHSRPVDQLEQIASRLRCRVLAISGRDDRLTSKPELDRILANLKPSAECVVLDDCGHIPHEEQPQAFVEALLKFLE